MLLKSFPGHLINILYTPEHPPDAPERAGSRGRLNMSYQIRPDQVAGGARWRALSKAFFGYLRNTRITM